jgi:hypothetical protein
MGSDEIETLDLLKRTCDLMREMKEDTDERITALVDALRATARGFENVNRRLEVLEQERYPCPRTPMN